MNAPFLSTRPTHLRLASLAEPDECARIEAFVARHPEGTPFHRPAWLTAVAAGTVWGIPRDRVFIVVREDVTLDIDKSAYFASDSVGVRAIMRVGFGYPHEAAVVRLFDETP